VVATPELTVFPSPLSFTIMGRGADPLPPTILVASPGPPVTWEVESSQPGGRGGIFVQRVVQGARDQKRIEKRTLRGEAALETDARRARIVRRAALEMHGRPHHPGSAAGGP
jgi:hypothetical protein